MGKKKKKSGYWVYQYLTNSTNKWNAVLSLFKILSLSISRFETRTRILSSKSRSSRRERDFLSISQGSRRDRDIFFQVSCFEMGLRDEINLILTRIFEIEKSRHALTSGYQWIPVYQVPVYQVYQEDQDQISSATYISDVVFTFLANWDKCEQEDCLRRDFAKW